MMSVLPCVSFEKLVGGRHTRKIMSVFPCVSFEKLLGEHHIGGIFIKYVPLSHRRPGNYVERYQ